MFNGVRRMILALVIWLALQLPVGIAVGKCIRVGA